MTLSKIAVVVIAVVAALAGSLFTFLASDRVPVSQSQPPGCTKADQNEPGCRVARQRITTNTVALASVIVSPLATLAVALVAVSSARRRQDEQIDAERDRHESRLEHELAIKRLELDASKRQDDLEHLRTFLDNAATRFEDYLEASGELRSALFAATEIADDSADLPDAIATQIEERASQLRETRRLADVIARQLDLRLSYDHPIRKAFWASVDRVDDSARALPFKPPLLPELYTQSEDSARRAMRSFAVFTSTANAYVGTNPPDTSAAEFAKSAVDELLDAASDLSQMPAGDDADKSTPADKP